jgi:hypothetical protein
MNRLPEQNSFVFSRLIDSKLERIASVSEIPEPLKIIHSWTINDNILALFQNVEMITLHFLQY